MVRKLSLLSFFMLISIVLFSQSRDQRYRSYINNYKQLSIDCMRDYGIPASIKLAQALIESDAGGSRLATVANNHFGIKCKSDWKGQTISHDDDAAGECFRKYNSAYDSYIDHSEFLSNSSRYDFLFDYQTDDYKSWAKGLKSAGYATNPAYADMLIKVIEEYELYNLDKGGEVGVSKEEQQQPEPQLTVVTVAPMQQAAVVTTSKSALVERNIYDGAKALPGDFAVLKTSPVTTYRNNNVAFIIAENNDTFDSIAAKTGKSKKSLMAYNQITKEPEEITQGTIIYVAAKKSKAANGHISHSVARGETLHYVSQLYGMRIEKLAELNNFDANYTIKQGQRLRLR